MDTYELTRGEGGAKLRFSVQYLGDGLVACVCNENAHLGAVALAEYDYKEERVSTSVITRLGHKDDAVAQRAAYLLSKNTKRPTCVIASVHIASITEEEIKSVLETVDLMVKDFLRHSTRVS